jgi:hypothetical protein
VSCDQLAHLFLELAQDPGLVLADGVGGNAKLLGDLIGGDVVDGNAPEGRPGGVAELRPDEAQGAVVDAPDLGRRLGELGFAVGGGDRL